MADDITGASLNGIYQRLNEAPTYHPLEADTFADWSMEAGDVVTVMRDGKEYKSPVHTTNVSWQKKQKVTISSTGSKERESVTKTSQRKFGRGGSLLRNSKETYWFVGTKYDQMSSGLELASSSAAIYVRDQYNQMTSGLKLTSSSAAMYVRDNYNQMTSGLKLTSSSAAMYVHDQYNQMTSGLKLTSSSAAMYVRDQYNQMTSGLKLTSSSAAMYVRDNYNQMTSGLKLTSSSAAMYVRDNYNQMTSGLKLTSSSAAMYVRDNYNQMTSGLKLSSSSAAIYVRDKYNQMTSGLKLTSSSAAIYVRDQYNQMTSGLKLTSSSAAIYVRDKYNEMTSGLKLTSSSAAIYVRDKYNEMTSGLKLTSSSAAIYVQDMYNQMTSGLKLTSSSAAIYAESRTSRAYIMARINANGEGEALIEADKVKISGDTTLAGALSVTNGIYSLSGNIQAGLTGGNYIRATEFKVLGGSSSQGANEASITYDTVYSMIIKAEVDASTNTLKLWKRGDSISGDPSITFSKATGTSLAGEWVGGGVFKATASPQGEEVFTSLTGSVSRSGRTMTCHPYATINNSPTIYDTDKDLTGTITIAKSEVSASWEKYSGSGTPDADVQMPPISTNGWHIISVTVLGTTKKFRINITA